MAAKNDRTDRDARLAAALRANLRRRKAQAAAPGDAHPQNEQDPPPGGPDPQRPIA